MQSSPDCVISKTAVGMASITIRKLSDETKERLRAGAERRGSSLAALVRSILDQAAQDLEAASASRFPRDLIAIFKRVLFEAEKRFTVEPVHCQQASGGQLSYDLWNSTEGFVCEDIGIEPRVARFEVIIKFFAKTGGEKEKEKKACHKFRVTNAHQKVVEGWLCCCRGKDNCNQGLRPGKGTGTPDWKNLMGNSHAARIPLPILLHSITFLYSLAAHFI